MTVDEPLHVLRQTRAGFLDVYLLAAVPAALVIGLKLIGTPTNLFGILAAGGLALLLVYSVEINRMRSIYKITPNQVVMEKGILKKNRKSVFLDNIVDVNFRQGYIERLLNYGTIVIGSSGGRTHEECEVTFDKVRNPKYYVMEIEKAIRGFGVRPGHIAPAKGLE